MKILSTEEAESFLNLPSGSGEDRLDNLIEDISLMMARASGRSDWGPQVEREEYKDGGESEIMLDFFPIKGFATTTPSIQVFDDNEHLFGPDTKIDIEDYWVTDKGIVSLEAGRFVRGHQTVKVIHTSGYINEETIPPVVKTYAKRQLEKTWNARYKSGRSTASADSLELLDEVIQGISEFRRLIPFA